MSDINTTNTAPNTNLGTIKVESVAFGAFALKGLEIDIRASQTDDTVRVYAGILGDLVAHLKSISDRVVDHMIDVDTERQEQQRRHADRAAEAADEMHKLHMELEKNESEDRIARKDAESKARIAVEEAQAAYWQERDQRSNTEA